MIHFPVNRTGVVAKVWAVNGKTSPPCLVEQLPCNCWEAARQQYRHRSLGPPKPTGSPRFEILRLTQPATFSRGGRETGQTWKSWITLLFDLNFVTKEKCVWGARFLHVELFEKGVRRSASLVARLTRVSTRERVKKNATKPANVVLWGARLSAGL